MHTLNTDGSSGATMKWMVDAGKSHEKSEPGPSGHSTVGWPGVTLQSPITSYGTTATPSLVIVTGTMPGRLLSLERPTLRFLWPVLRAAGSASTPSSLDHFSTGLKPVFRPYRSDAYIWSIPHPAPMTTPITRVTRPRHAMTGRRDLRVVGAE